MIATALVARALLRAASRLISTLVSAKVIP